ncbi:hypothetical protein [Glutamicibacter nicotianae]
MVALEVPGVPGGPRKKLEFTIHATDEQRIATVDVAVSELGEEEAGR